MGPYAWVTCKDSSCLPCGWDAIWDGARCRHSSFLLMLFGPALSAFLHLERFLSTLGIIALRWLMDHMAARAHMLHTGRNFVF